MLRVRGRRDGSPYPATTLLLLLLIAAVTVRTASASASTPRPRPHSIRKRNPTYAPLSTSSLKSLSSLTQLDDLLDYNDPGSALSKLLVPRVAGSSNLTSLQTLVTQHFTKLGWHVERDHFVTSTPIGDRPFTNLIFTHDPKATRRFTLAAHLDSKYFPTHPEDQFVGATDSAAPCAMLLDVAQALTPWLDARRDRVTAQGGELGTDRQAETLQIIFFDGEEAFVEWTDDDSIYGAKHLAQEWSKITQAPSAMTNMPRSPIERISHLVLLDLLGASSPICRSFYGATGWLFDEFVNAEKKLGEAGYLWPGYHGKAYTKVSAQGGNNPRRSFFASRTIINMYAGRIEDDHIPFLQAGVPVVHMIPVPFPSVWHTMADNVDALDLGTIKAWSLILRVVTAEYLGLDANGGRVVEDKGRRRNEL